MLLLLILCIATTSIVSVVYAKYVTDQTGNADVDVIAEGVLQVGIDDGSGNKTAGTYTIKNVDSSNIPAFIRAAVVVNWRDGDGNLWAIPLVEGVNYTISSPECTKIGNYYYYNGTRNPNDGFNITVTAGTPKDGYVLDVKILAEGIQSLPTTAAKNAWGVEFNGTAWN